MKKNLIVLAMLALVIGSAFTADISTNVEISTDIVKLRTDDIDKSVYFTSHNYDDVELSLGVALETFGAYISIGADAQQANITMYDTYAWVKPVSFAKITLGDFSSRTANVLTSIIDEYQLGIFKYGINETDFEKLGFSGDNIIEGDSLTNFVMDFSIGPATVSFGINPYMNTDIPALKITKYHLNVGGRVYSRIANLLDITLTAVYDDPNTRIFDNAECITVGAFVGFPNLLENFSVMAGYTASIIDDELENGIDLRAEMFWGNFAFATHNNLSLYGDEQMVVYNELKAERLLTDVMAVSVAARSHYYNSNNASDKKAIYDLGIYLGFDYAVNEAATLSTGIDITGITLNTTSVVIGIPFALKISF